MSEELTAPELEQKEQSWPFDIWLRLVVLHMHLSPQDFWDMSVRDWFALCHRNTPTQFSQMNLTSLMQAFPDETDGDKKDN